MIVQQPRVRMRLQLAGDEAVTGTVLSESQAYLIIETEPPPGSPADTQPRTLVFPWHSIQAGEILSMPPKPWSSSAPEGDKGTSTTKPCSICGVSE